MSISPLKGKTLGFWSTVAIGIGGMVGGGIFAVLGLAVQMAGGGTPLAFLISGVVALLTAYSYARLSVAYPTRGGTVEFLNQGLDVVSFNWKGADLCQKMKRDAQGQPARRLVSLPSRNEMKKN